jgi:predicted nuclease of predicted toxin-antitoxin system
VKLKLDENIGQRGAELLRAGGHDIATVVEQGLQGTSDERLFEVCAGEGRALITLDRDFGQVLRFPLAGSPGVAVLELGPRPSQKALEERMRELMTFLRSHELKGSLWIVEPGRVRIHLPDDAG